MAPRFTNRTYTRAAISLLIALVALEVLLPTGCIGIEAAIGKKRRTVFRPAYLTNPPPAAGGEDHVTLVHTSAEVSRLWGPPDRRRVLNGREIWMYRAKGLKWRGIWVWAVLVPIPLQVPTGRNKLTLEFEGDSLRAVTVQCRGEKFYGFSLLSGRLFSLGQTNAFDQSPWQCN